MLQVQVLSRWPAINALLLLFLFYLHALTVLFFFLVLRHSVLLLAPVCGSSFASLSWRSLTAPVDILLALAVLKIRPSTPRL